MNSTTLKKLLSLLTAFAMVFGMIALVRPMQANAATVEIPISNGDFENGAFGGAVSTNGAATIVDNKNVHSGNYSVHMTKDGTNPNGTMTITVYPTATDADRTLTMKFWMMIPSGSTANSVHTQMLAWREWGSLLSEQYGAQYVAVDGNWYEKTVSVPVPANTGIVQVQLYAADTGTTPYIDDISMVLDGVDLMTNGGIENGALNGGISYSDGSIEVIHAPVHSGSYAAHTDKATGGMITTTVSVGASANARTMNLSYWLYVKPGAAANGAHNGVFCFDTVTNSPNWSMLTQKYGAQYAAHGQWTQMNLPIEVAAGTDTLQIQIYADDEGADFYIDDLKLTEEVASVNHDVTLSLNQVTGDGTWQFSISEVPANKYYKVPATIDGAQCNFLMGESGGIMCVYPNFFTALGGAVPTQQIVIEAGTVLKAADPNNGWNEIEGADTYTLTEAIDLSYVNGAWSKTVYTTDVELSLTQVTGDGTWQFSISETPANKYYKVPATIDGVQCNFLMGESGGIMCVYPNFFTAIGGAVPTGNIVIAEGALLKAVDPNNGWAEIEGATVLAVSKKIDLSYVDGAWSKTVYTTNVDLSLMQVTGDGTWQFAISPAPANKYYKVPAIIDGAQCNFLMGESSGIMCVYPNFFTAIGGAVPAESLVIPAGTVMYAVDANNGWQVVDGANTLTITNDLSVEYNLGVWKDMSQYADVTFEEITADDLIIYKWEDQAESNYRSVFGIYAPNAQFGNDAAWGNFTKVAGKVLIDGAEVSAVYGMAPGADGDSSWGANNAILLYITGEGYWDAVSTASSVTVCAGTMLVSGVDNTKGVKFTEDFTMYKNCDGSWDTTADTHIYNQQNTELEGALVSAATMQSPAVYYYSCVCGALGTETFTYGDVLHESISISLQTVTADGTWQLIPSIAPADSYYKIPVIIDGKACNVLAQYGSNLLLIYPNFFTALNGAVPAESFVIPAGTVMTAVDSNNGWAELEGAYAVSEELKIENIAGKWVEMSKYADVSFTEIYGADLDLYYQNIMRLGDYSDLEVQIALQQYPEYKPLYDIYGRDANMTTFGIKSSIPTLQIPNDSNWTNFTLLGTISVQGATPAETYVMQTPDSSDDAETAMTSAFLIRFYNGFIADNATSITIEPGTRIVTKDGAGFVFVDGYTIYRDENGNWSDTVPAGVYPVNKWGLTLGDNIGVNFEMNVNTGDVVTFTVNGESVVAVNNGKTYTIALSAAQMTDEIAISVNGVALDKTYSVRAYADIILAGTYGEATKNLVKNMLVYGGAAQTYFGHNTGNLASAGIAVDAAVPTGAEDFTANDGLDSIDLYGATLVLRDRIAVRYYFNADSIDGLTATVNGDECQLNKKGDRYYVEVANINPQNLGDQITVVVSDGTNSLTATYNPLNYVVRMYEKADSSAALKAVVQALYGYHLAAQEYTA